ncbi:hypothetical protein ACFVWN_08785 [Nocardiopsis flavescens]|uniref:hypothetical protein n=1 Tax=Nocardiopsis flavescens TaxID=758803 RepID=UPI003663583A
MQNSQPRPGVSTPLPPYRAVLAVDMERFSATEAVNQQTIGVLIPQVLEEAFKRSDLEPVWTDRRFPRHAGDGYVLGTEPHHLPFLISPLLANLQEVLEEVQPNLAVRDRNLRMRLRLSIDVGPLPDVGDGSGIDAMGQAMIDTHRLLDSEPVRRELKDSDPDTTLLAAIISRRVFEDVVLGGFTTVNPRRWKPVTATVQSKDFQAEGYLFVPTPSWSADSVNRDAEQEQEGDGTGGSPDRSADTSGTDGRGQSFSIDRNDGQAFQMGTVNGGVNFGGGANGG